MSPKTHQENCSVVKRALESVGYKCAPSTESHLDFIAKRRGTAALIGRKTTLNVQVWPRFHLSEKQRGRNVDIAFPDKTENCVYIGCLDKIFEVGKNERFMRSRTWMRDRVYHSPPIPKWALESDVLSKIPQPQE